jgi:Rha family phage regulatory protein
MEAENLISELTITNHNGTLVADSREVANMIGKRHDHLMRDIQGYAAAIEKSAETVAVPNAPKFGAVDFFIPSTYVDPKGETRPCYLLTKQGCEMVANKLTGEKGVLFTAAYVQQFNTMEKFIKGEKLDADEKFTIQRMKAEAALKNANARQAALWAKFSDMLNTPEHKQICAAYGTQVLNGGQMVLPLPQVEKTYSAKEVGDMYGISAQMVGRLANQNGLKTSEYGSLRLDKSPYCDKEVETWRYNQKGADAIGRLTQ